VSCAHRSSYPFKKLSSMRSAKAIHAKTICQPFSQNIKCFLSLDKIVFPKGILYHYFQHFSFTWLTEYQNALAFSLQTMFAFKNVKNHRSDGSVICFALVASPDLYKTWNKHCCKIQPLMYCLICRSWVCLFFKAVTYILFRYGAPYNTEYKLTVENLSSRASWQVRIPRYYNLLV